MEEKYENQLETVARAVPDEGGLIALVATIAADQAAALASDLAQSISRGRTGHTLLLSIENRPAALDHEIGAEVEAGLTEVLAGSTPLAEVASRGGARGYVYVPAGSRPADATELLSSSAFASLSASAVAKGATVLAFIPAGVLRRATPPAVEGVVWLGPAPGASETPTGWATVGALRPPDGPAEEPESAPADPAPAEPAPAEPAPAADRESPAQPRREASSTGGRRGRTGTRWVTGGLVAIALVTIVLASFILTRSRSNTSLLPQNDSLWLAPPGAAGDNDSIP